MSNKENSCVGYLIEAAKLAVFIPENQRTIFHNALMEHDFDEAIKFLDQFIPDDVARPTQIFVLNDTDAGDENMEEGTAYAFFDEEDLYEKREKSDLIRLREKMGSVPTAYSWTIWG
jgi:hypothetical protein